jgi:hypothetical protein
MQYIVLISFLRIKNIASGKRFARAKFIVLQHSARPKAGKRDVFGNFGSTKHLYRFRFTGISRGEWRAWLKYV